MNYLMLWFFKITAWPLILLKYRPKVRMYKKGVKRPNVRCKILIANHYSVYDMPFIMFTFFFRTVYFVAGEYLYKKRALARWITSIGAIRCDRDQKDVDWIYKSEKLLAKGKTILVFPQARLSADNDAPYKEAFIILAARANAQIVSLYVNGKYRFKERAQMIIGKTTDVNTLWSDDKDLRGNLHAISAHFENYNKELQKVYEKQFQKNR